MHVWWLVSNLNAFEKDPGPTSEVDCVVPGLTYAEWFELFFVVLGVAREKTAGLDNSGRDAHFIEFDEEITGFPMLSRISGVYWDASFERDEVQDLQDECERLMQVTRNELARVGIEKIVSACKKGIKLGLGIFVMCD